jgi:DNA primase
MTRLKPPLLRQPAFTMNFFYPTQRSIPKFSHISLAEGLEKSIIERFQIGYSPAYVDAEHCGRALINGFLERFDDDYRTFRHFQDGCLVRLLNDKGARGYGYYLQQTDFTTRSPFARNYGDYFAGRIVFPIRNAASEVIGFIGRRPDNRGVRWLKQQAGESAITTKSWLYGIDKAYRFIKHYRTVILVEGIFDYFAFYRLLQDQAGRWWCPLWVPIFPPRRWAFSNAWCGALHRCV